MKHEIIFKIKKFNQKKLLIFKKKLNLMGLILELILSHLRHNQLKTLRIKYQFKPKVNSLEEEINYLINSINNSRNIEIFKLWMGLIFIKKKH